MARRGLDTPNKRDPDGLTDRQLAFIDHYLGDCFLNQSKAALKAGYAHRQEGARLIANPVIRARIDAILADGRKTRDEVLEMLVNDAVLDIDEILNQSAVKNDPAARASTISALMNARTTGRGTLAKAYGLLSDKVQAGGGIVIKIEGIDGDEV